MEITKRFDRILAIFIQLQAKPIVKAQDLADKFQVSLRTIYRDIRSLENAGIPIYAEAGIGYSLVDGYKMPPTLFTKEEAMSFAVAEKLMQRYVDQELSKNFSMALSKMKAVLRNSDKEKVSAVESKVFLSPAHQSSFNEKVPSALALLFNAIARQKQIQLTYLSPEATQPNQRKIEPIGVFHENGYWYMMAYCYLRNAPRQFRLDRIQQLHVLEDKFAQTHHPLSFYLDKKEIAETENVRILVQHNMARYLHWERKHFGFVSEKKVKDGIEMIFETANLSYFARWFMMFGDEARVIEPTELKDMVQQLNQKIAANIKN